jgi:hypothetical protein
VAVRRHTKALCLHRRKRHVLSRVNGGSDVHHLCRLRKSDGRGKKAARWRQASAKVAWQQRRFRSGPHKELTHDKDTWRGGSSLLQNTYKTRLFPRYQCVTLQAATAVVEHCCGGHSSVSGRRSTAPRKRCTTCAIGANLSGLTYNTAVRPLHVTIRCHQAKVYAEIIDSTGACLHDATGLHINGPKRSVCIARSAPAPFPSLTLPSDVTTDNYTRVATRYVGGDEPRHRTRR